MESTEGNIEQLDARSRNTNAELRRLSSANNPGLSEDGENSRAIRSRRPTSTVARSEYEEYLEKFKRLMNDLFEPDRNNSGLPVQKQLGQENYQQALKDFSTLQEKSIEFQDAL